jgi:DNA modification methylase
MKSKGDMMMHRAENQFWAYNTAQSSSEDLLLLDNVQFIYELSLAQMELKSLGVDFQVTNGLREFKLLNRTEDIKARIKRRAAYFKKIEDEYTDYFFILQKNRTRSVNQYLTHWIYPYKGKFHPQMIRALLNIVELQTGDTVLDPFSGSGTTALEAQLLGVNSINVDVSPLCVIQAAVKTESIYVLDEIERLKSKVIFHPHQDLFSGDADYYRFVSDLTSDERVKNFYKLARLLALSDNSRRGRDFTHSFNKNIDLMLASIRDYAEIREKLNLKLGEVEFRVGDSRKVDLPDNSIDGVITSPPYSIALDYVKNDEHALKDLGCDLSELRNSFMGVRGNGKNRLHLYNEDMKKSYSEMHRVLKPEKHAVIVIGNAMYESKEIKTVEFTIHYMERIGFSLLANIDKLIFGLYNVMKRENILIFKKVN